MKTFLTIIFVLLFKSTTISQPSFEYYRNPEKVGSSNEKAFEYFKTAYYDHVFSWTRKGADRKT